MKVHRGPLTVMGVIWLLGSGCTTLREIPRSEYTAEPERRHVQMRTDEGLIYEFDYVRVSNDTIIGYRQRDVEGPVEDIATFGVPVSAVARLSARKVDWYRTGLIGGGVLAAVIAAGLGSGLGDGSGGTSGGNKTPPGLD